MSLQNNILKLMEAAPEDFARAMELTLRGAVHLRDNPEKAERLKALMVNRVTPEEADAAQREAEVMLADVFTDEEFAFIRSVRAKVRRAE